MDKGTPEMAEMAAAWYELYGKLAAKSILKGDALPLTDYALG